MKKIISIAFFLISITLFKCQDEPSLIVVHTGLVKDVSAKGALFTGFITATFGNPDIQEYGFVWSLKDQPTLQNNFFRAGLGSPAGEFDHLIQSELLPNTLYYMRAYAKQSIGITYGEVMEFRSNGSLGPALSSFDPASGSSNTIITIRGNNFSHRAENNLVRIGVFNCKVLSSTDIEIKAQLPTAISISGKFKVAVTVGDKTVLSGNEFTLEGPVPTEVIPLSGIQGTLITIKGTGFSSIPSENKVSFGTTDAPVISATSTQLTVRVPPTSFSGEVTLTIKVKGVSGQFVSPFVIEGPEIFTISPAAAYGGDILTITGKNFSPFIVENKVLFSNYHQAKILQASTSELKVEIPFSLSINLGSTIDVSVTVTEKIALKAKAFTTKSPWSFAPEFAGQARTSAAAFTIDNIGYVGTGVFSANCSCFLNDLWAFDPKNNSWKRKADFAGSERGYAIGFSANGKGYIGGGYHYVDHGYYNTVDANNELWEYDPATDLWTQKNNLPGNITSEYQLAFTIGDKGYLLYGSSLFEYDPSFDQWILKEDFPGSGGDRFLTIAFEINGKGYVSLNAKDFYEYNVQLNTWSKKADFPALQGTYGFGSFAKNGKGYAGCGRYYADNFIMSYEFYRYDPVQDIWLQIPSTPASLQNTVSFVLDGVPYFGIGREGDFVRKSVMKLNSDF